jgi:hypothetical protein
MSQRIALAFALVAIVGCGSNSNNTMNPGIDMAAGGGGGGGSDMPMVMNSTIAAAIMGKVTTPITVDAIVTGIVGTGSSTWYIQDPAGGPYSGVAVFCSHTAKTNPCPMSISAPSLHDEVTITGTLSAYHGKLELNPTAQTTTKTNVMPAAPMAVSDADAAVNSTNAAVRGFPVKLMGNSFTVDNVTPSDLYDTQCKGDAGASAMHLCSGCMPPTYSGFEVSDGTVKIYVEQNFFQTDKLVSSPECVGAAAAASQVQANRKFTALAGILDVDPYAPKSSGTVVALQPTADTDYQ